MVLLVIVNALNLAAATAMAVFLVRHLWPITPDRQSRFQLAAKYVRFFSVFGLMASRFTHYQLWVMAQDGSTVPYWRITPLELTAVGLYLVAVVAALVAPRIIERKWGEQPLPTLRPYFGDPLFPAWIVCEHVSLCAKTRLGKRVAAQFLGGLTGIVCMLGLFYALVTLLPYFTDVR